MSRGWCPLTKTVSWLVSVLPATHCGSLSLSHRNCPKHCLAPATNLFPNLLHLCQWDQLGASHFSNSISFFTLASSLWVQPEGVIFQSQTSILTPGSKHSPLSLFPHPTPLHWVLQQPQPSCLLLRGMRRNRKYTQHSPSKRRVIS